MSVLVFPKRKTIVRVLNIPASDPREIDAMVKLQAARQTPLGPEEIAIDYQVLETTADGNSRVHLVIVRNTDLEEEIAKYAKGEVSAERVIFQEGSGHEFNLLSEAAREKKRRDLLKKQFGKWAAGFFAGGAILTVLIGAAFFLKHRELENLNRKALAVDPETQDLRRMAGKMKAIKAQLSEPGSLLNAIAELNRLVPERVSLQSLDFEQARTVLVQGTCFTLSDAVHLVEILQKSPLFTNVELRSTNIQRLRDREIVDFTVSFQIHAKI